MNTIRVKNLEKYQHYKHRNPPWVKLYREVWTDYTLRQLTVSERLLFLGLCSLGMELGNQIPNDPSYLSARLGFAITQAMISHLLASDLVLSNLILSNLEEHNASTLLADCVQDASKTSKVIGKTAFPMDWKINGEALEAWRKFKIDPHVEFASFKDHALTNDRRCSNWEAAFRNWCRKTIKMKEAR